MSLAAQSVDVVHRFCETVSDRSAVSLELLRTIDHTVDWLSTLQNASQSDTAFARKFTEWVASLELGQPIDPDGVVVERIRTGESALAKIIARLKLQRQSAVDDPVLTGDHEDCILVEYDQTIQATVELSEAMHELCDAVKTHDDELRQTVGSYDTVNELLDAIEGE